METKQPFINLILFTSTFPFGADEAYIENEIGFLSNGFRKIVIITNATDCKVSRKIPPNVTVLHRTYQLSLTEKILSLSKLLSPDFLYEFLFIVRKYRIKPTPTIVNTILQSLYKACLLEKFLTQKLPEIARSPQTVYYSYWADDNAAALAYLKKRGFIYTAFCRAHRWDVYFEKNAARYLPLRRTLATYLTGIFFISGDGLQYFVRKVGQFKSLKISRLGVFETGSSQSDTSDTSFHILSCSAVIERKRVHMIAQALALVQDSGRKIKWTHIGNGPLFRKLSDTVTSTLSKNKNVEINLVGNMSNQDVRNFYSHNAIDLFINVSESEGVPVAIMEAMSASIPAIATSVEGNREIVNDGINGFLLNKNFSPQDLSLLIEKCQNIDLSVLRQNAYNTWLEKYNAHRNYTAFVEHLQAG